MFETFIYDTKTDLGPLTPNWFEELTVKASRNVDIDVGKSMTTRPSSLEDNALKLREVKAEKSLPSRTSTPKLLQKPSLASPEFLIEGTSPSGQIMALMESSPCLFRSEKKSQPFKHERGPEPKMATEPEDTPKRFSSNVAQRISESLGAQINPDLSWSSSLNTPSSLTPTYILTKIQEQSSAVETSEERIIFVRQLFPPVFKDDILETSEEDSPFIDEIKEKKIDTSSEGKLKVPDAIEDGELQSTIKSVCDGTEEVLSFFFASGNSSLRRVRTRERMTRSLTSESQEAPENTVGLRKQNGHTEPNLPFIDVTSKNRDCEKTQWTPLSLSEISGSSVEQGHSVESSTNQHMQHQEHDYASQHNVQTSAICATDGQKFQSDMQLDAPVFVSTPEVSCVPPSHRKPKKYIYSVRNSSLPPRQDIREQFYKPLHQYPTVPCSDLLQSTDRAKLQKPNEDRNRNQAFPSTLTLEKDVDMSQLCKAFAEDFSQHAIPSTSPVNGEKVEWCQSTLNPGSKFNRDAGTLPLCEQHAERFSEQNNSPVPGQLGIQSQLDISNKVHQGQTLNNATNNTTLSGGNSTIRHEVSRCFTESQSQTFSDFKTANDNIISLPQKAINWAKALLDEFEGDAFTDTTTVSNKDQSDNTKGTQMCRQRSPYSHVSSAGQKNSRLQPKRNISGQKYSAPHHPWDFSGFRTGRDRTINVSSLSILKAKQMFKKLEDDCSIDNPIEVQLKEKAQAPESVFDMKTISLPQAHPLSPADAYSALTASQKADVSELCSLLEDANSQCEFTQVKPLKVNSSKPQESAQYTEDREWDSDILTNINFDDSFSSDIEHHKSMQRSSVKLNTVLHVNVENVHVNEISQSNFKMDLSSSMKNVVGVQDHDLQTSQKSCVEMINDQKSIISNPELGVFRGKSLDNCSSDTNFCIKEEPKVAHGRTIQCGDEGIFGRTVLKMTSSVTLNSSVSHSEENLCGFRTAGGKKVHVSETALLQAKALLNCHAKSNHTELEEELKDDDSTTHKGLSGGQPCGGLFTEDTKMVCVSVEASPKASSLLDKVHPAYDFVSNHCNSNSLTQNDERRSEKAYRAVRKKNVCVSTKVQQDPSTLKDHYGCTENSAGIKATQDNPLGSNLVGYLEVERDSGFRTARGKSVLVSEKALLKARSVLSEAVENDPSDSDKYLSDFTKSSVKMLPIGKKSNFYKDEAHVLISGESTGAAVNWKNSSHDMPEKEERLSKAETCHSDSGESFGFSTANGKHISVSSTALQKGIKFFDERAHPQGSEHSNGCSVECPPVQCNSRQHSLVMNTSSGKGISVFAESAQAGKALTECDSSSKLNCIRTKYASKNGPDNNNVADYSPSKTKHWVTAVVSSGDIIGEHSLPNSRVAQCGFRTASGKHVSVSSTAIEHAKLLLDDRTEESKPLMSVELQHHEQMVPHGNLDFDKASGNCLPVTAKSLKSAHVIFDGSSHVQLEVMPRIPVVSCGKSTENPCHTDLEAINILCCSDITKTVQNGDTKSGECSVVSFGVSTANSKEVSVSNKALKEACKQLEKCGVDTLSKRNSDITPAKNTMSSCLLWPEATPDSETNQCNISYQSAPPKELSSQSDDLSNCTTMPQRYFEQETEACFKALSKDEDHLNDALNGTSGPSQKNPYVEQKWSGKRNWEFDYYYDQPPLKRRLLAEFDKSKTPHVPFKSSPNGVLNDRTVKYNVLLQSNVALPHRTSMAPKWVKEEPELTTPLSFHKQFLEKVTVFVPPFSKQANPDDQKGETSVVHCTKTQSVFVPPFKTFHSTAEAAGHTEIHAKCCGFVPVRKKICPQAEPYNQDSFIPSNLGHSQTPHCRTGDGDLSHMVELNLRHETPNTDVPTEDYKSSSPSASEEALQCIQLAGEMQEMRIRKKKRQTIRPLPGSLFLAKTSGMARVSLRAAVRYMYPRRHPEERLYMYGVPSEVCQVSSSSAKSFQFPWRHFFKWETLSQAGGVQLADGGWLIPDNEGMLGKEQFYKALCDTPGVDPKLISEEWVYNHYRWIVWKRASMERAFPKEFGGLCLTPEQVLLQLKYRYDVEIDRSQRSALKKITERDDSSAKTMVLCLCDVETTGTAGRTDGPVSTIWLTDGWYRLRAALDPPLTAMLQRGLMKVGDKLVTHGAELVGPQDACPPLEVPESLMLKISANSTRLARWDARLGYHYDPRPFQLPLDTLFSDGGVVGCVNILVLRSYPMQWMEKTAGGTFIFRSERAEEREARSYEEQKQKAMEMLFRHIQAQLEKEEEQERRNRRVQKRTFTRREMAALQDGEELHEAMESDPTFLKADLCKEQLASLCSFRRSLDEKRQVWLQERFQQALRGAEQGSASCPSRDVSPVWKLAVCDSNRQQSSSSKSSSFLLNIWRPSMELLTLLKEGGRYRAYHLSTSEGRRKASTAAIQLTATKKTRFEHIKVGPELLQECFEPRQCPSFSSLQSPLFHSLCQEVDVVGYIVYISDRNGPSPVVYLVDERVDFVSVRCSNTLRQLAVEELVKPQTLLIVSNALHCQASAPIPALYAGEFTVFKTSSSEPHIQQRIRQLKSLDQSQVCFLKGAEEKLSTIIPVHSSLIQLPSRTPSWTSDPCQNARNKPAPPITSVAKGTLVARTSEGNHPKSQKRQRGFEYLSRIPSPPPLSPLGAVVSPHVKKTFNPPRRFETLCTKSNIAVPSSQVPNLPPSKDEWVKDEELALINTQSLLDGLAKPD